MGKLLGDPAVWDDTPARPRLLLRALVGLVSGVVVGGLVAAAVTPRPDPVPPPLAAPPRRDAPAVPVDPGRLANIATSAGPMLVVRHGSLESTNPDGTGRRVVAQNVGPRAVVPGRDGFVWQGPARNLLASSSAARNLELPMLLAGLPGARRRRRVAVLLVLLADEPTSQLDRASVERVVGLLKEAREDLGTTVVLVTHDAEAAAAMDRTVTIRDGRVSAEGRGDAEYAVVGPTGSLHLPADALGVLPPGARVAVEVDADRVGLRPLPGPEDDPR